MRSISIGGKRIGPDRPVFVIAEAGINHNGSLETARRLIDAAAEAGCDAVKFQKRSVRRVLSREAYERPYSNGGHSYGRTYGEHRENLELRPDDYRRLRGHARGRGILFLASSWDEESADFVDSLDVPAHKIGSPDLTHLPLCRYVAEKGRPVLLSTGMSELEEVDAAVRTILERNPDLVVLHCVSIYPAPPRTLRLRWIPRLRDRYGLPVGYSGHEEGWAAVLAAVALGACVVEKHITLDRTMKGGDHRFSLEPADLRDMVRAIRTVELALQDGGKHLQPGERPFREKLAKSVTTREGIQAGQVITRNLLTCKSPGTGISPLDLESVVGRRAARDLPGDAIVRSEDILRNGRT